MKRAALATAVLAALAALAWAAGLGYTAWRVRRAIVRLREEHLDARDPGSFAPRGLPSAQVVARLGCRALPALMAELDPRLSPYYLCRVGDCLTEVTDGEAPRAYFDDDPARRARAVETLLAWWRAEGAAHHQWWRFWTSRCRPLIR